MENYTKYKLKSSDELASVLNGKDNLFVIACNKCFKEFETVDEPDCKEFLKFAAEQGKTVTGSAKFDFLCNKMHTERKLQDLLPEGTENVVVISCGLGIQTVADLAGKPVSADTGASDIKIINHGTLTLIDSGTDGTLSIPIENDGVLNANGGTVTGKVTNRGTIQATGTPVTQFTGTLVNQEGASVTAGDFRGCTITNNGGTIGGGAILDKPEPDPEQPGAGSEDGGAGAVIAALAVGTAVVGGGILLAHSYIQNNLPEGFAVPETRQELAVVLWNMAGKPEPASQQTYTDVQDEEVLKAVCWAVENELVTPETESTLGADVRVNRLQVIGAMYQTNKRKK